MNRNIAIDGPAGAGKSTIARRVASSLGAVYVDTGAMYRAMALYFLRQGIKADDSDAISRAAEGADVTIEYRDGEQRVILGGEDVTPYLRTEEVGNMASVSSTNGDVRAKLVELQRRLAANTAVVMDGRDIGTVVLPDAMLKIYLTASVAVRAARRVKELVEKGENPDPARVAAEIEERDHRDMNREISPLRRAEDAVLVDSSDLSVGEVTETILKLYRERLNHPRVIVAKTAGFCFGVRKAVDKVYEAAGNGTPIYTFGPIIHNHEVVADLEKRGVKVINSVDELEDLKEGTVIIRSHGVSRAVYERIENAGLSIIDATCPFVKRIHRIVEQESAGGSQIVIIGNAGHPEVEGIVGWSVTPASVVGTPEEAGRLRLDPGKPVCIVSQTTFNTIKFQELVDILKCYGYNINVVNTICSATRERQEEARSIASQVDMMIVIGDRTSSNSAKLYDICRSECVDTLFIQTRNDLTRNLAGGEKVIGITAGASTPKNIIEEVQNYVYEGRREF